MATPTYTPLANVTLGSSASSVTFSSIPATYRDLVLVIDGLTVSSNDQPAFRFNSDTTTSYFFVTMEGNGSSTFSTNGSLSQLYSPINWTTTDRGSLFFQIMDYSTTNKHKPTLMRVNQASENGVSASAHRWSKTEAITTILARLRFGASFASGTTFALYGIEA